MELKESLKNNWIFLKKKNKNITGTFNENAFQISLINQNRTEDPLEIPIFDGLGYHCITHIGIYGDNYDPNLPNLLIKLPLNSNEDLIWKELPKNLINEIINKEMNLNFEFYIMIHNKILPQPCQHFQCKNMREINIMLHTWTFYDIKYIPETDIQTTVEMGLFDTTGVRTTHQFELCEELNAGISIDKLSKRLVGVHSLRFSPLNAQLLLEENELHSFYCVAKKDDRCIITYHLIPELESLSKEINECIKNSTNLYELLKNLSTINVQIYNECNKIFKLLLTLIHDNN